MGMFSRFPSYQHVVKSAVDSARRFPLTLLSALFATIIAIILIDRKFEPSALYLDKYLMAGTLGISWFLALSLLGEKHRWSSLLRVVVQIAGLALLAGYALSLPDDPSIPLSHVIRFALLVAGLHFLTACLPFLGKGHYVGFWEYNKSVLLRFLLAAFYSAVIYAGLAIALAAADHLFGADIDVETYGQLWVIVVGLFNTWFVMAGIPEDLNALNDDAHYPVGLKVFTQFVLLPLVGLYFVILFAYELKIIIEWNWPKGWVSELVLWYAVVGILSMLLLHPLRNRAENRWIKVFTTWYFRALIPLVGMLFFAIARRIGDYGITESRYLVLAMAIGLAVVLIYFVFSRTKDIRVIPAILTALAFVSAYGPWGAFAVSERSQAGRLEDLMVSNELLADGKLLAMPPGETTKDGVEMSNIVEYLCERHGVNPFARWLDEAALAELSASTPYQLPGQVCERLGFPYTPYAGYAVGGAYCRLNAVAAPAINLAGFDFLVAVPNPPPPDSAQIFELAGQTWAARFDQNNGVFSLGVLDGENALLPLGNEANRLVGPPMGYRDIPADSLTFDVDAETFRARLMLDFLSGSVEDSVFKVEAFTGRLLIGMK